MSASNLGPRGPIILDTDRELICFVCDIPIWPSEPKNVIGMKGRLYVVHPDCPLYVIPPGSSAPKYFYEH